MSFKLFRPGMAKNINKYEPRPVPQGDHRSRERAVQHVRVLLFVVGVLQCWAAHKTCDSRASRSSCDSRASRSSCKIDRKIFFFVLLDCAQGPNCNTGHVHVYGSVHLRSRHYGPVRRPQEEEEDVVAGQAFRCLAQMQRQ